MAIWRLITHHSDPERMLNIYRRDSRIAMGWSLIGDLRVSNPTNSDRIQQSIKGIKAYAMFRNTSAGRCLWGLYDEMKPGDLVILSVGKGALKDVVEVAGPYEYVVHPVDSDDYNHSRKVIWRNDLDGRVIRKLHPIAPTWNQYWALVRLM